VEGAVAGAVALEGGVTMDDAVITRECVYCRERRTASRRRKCRVCLGDEPPARPPVSHKELLRRMADAHKNTSVGYDLPRVRRWVGVDK